MVKDHCKPLNLEWLEQELDHLLYTATVRKTARFLAQSQKAIPELVTVIDYMINHNMGAKTDYLAHNLGISVRTARKYLKTLCDRRFCVRGKWVTFTDVNPFFARQHVRAETHIQRNEDQKQPAILGK